MLFACVLAIGFSLSAEAQSPHQYGKKFKTKKALQVSELVERLNEKNKLENVVVAGEISQVCQAEGCWMKLKNPDGGDIFVKFGNHDFTIPKDLAGRKAVVNGTATRKTISVEEQKHYAEDAGKSEAEIAAITEPKTELRINATGVSIE